MTSDAAVSPRWGGSVWGRMAAAAVTCGTPGGKSQDLLPASPPPRQGAQLHRPRRGTPRGRPLLLLGFAPRARFRPPPPRQGAPLRVGPHRGPAVTGLPGGPPHPRCPSLAVRPRTLLRSFSRTSLSAGRRQDPPTSELLPGPPPHLRGPATGRLRTLADGLAWTAHLCPGAESLPQPTQRSSEGPPPHTHPRHPRTPGGARAESLLQLPSVPPGGWGLGLEPEW